MTVLTAIVVTIVEIMPGGITIMIEGRTHCMHHGCAQGRGTERGYCAALGARGVGWRSARAERQAGLPGAYLRVCWLLATILFVTNARAPCAWVSALMSSPPSTVCSSFIFLHMLSQALAETLWHVRSTCHVIGV